MKHWQEEMLADLVSHFEPNDDVLGLLLFGSLSEPEFQPDDWSDIDILLVLREGIMDRFFPTVEWLASFGDLYTYSQSADEFKCTTRVVFVDLRRVDFVITTEGKLAQIEQWSSVPFSCGARVLFSRSKILEEIARRQLVQHPPPTATEEQFLELARNFRFKSTLAVYKVARHDLLIAVHLAQDLIRDCCVLGMLLRDRATGTRIHKQGGIGNQIVAQLEGTQQPFTPAGILESIRASSEVFERLALEWSSSYQENRQVLLDWIERAKAAIPE